MSKAIFEVPTEDADAIDEGAKPRRKMFTIRLLPVEHAAFKSAADARGLPLMVWLRCAGRKIAGLDTEVWAPHHAEGLVVDEAALSAARKTVTVRLFPVEHEAFKRAAEARGLPMMTWLRGAGRKLAGLDPAD